LKCAKKRKGILQGPKCVCKGKLSEGNNVRL
jgi:hypothetical protein